MVSGRYDAGIPDQNINGIYRLKMEVVKNLKAFLPYIERLLDLLENLKNASKNRFTSTILERANEIFRDKAKEYGFLPSLEEEIKYDNLSKERIKKLLEEMKKEVI
jgi:hypothetical protein